MISIIITGTRKIARIFVKKHRPKVVPARIWNESLFEVNALYVK